MTASVWEIRLEMSKLLDVDLGLTINVWCKRNVYDIIVSMKVNFQMLLSFVKEQ